MLGGGITLTIQMARDDTTCDVGRWTRTHASKDVPFDALGIGPGGGQWRLPVDVAVEGRSSPS